MKLPFDRLFTWSWRLAIFTLPWQTRWFAEGLSLGGLPWEQGRWSIYVSWLPMVATILLGLRWEKRKIKPTFILPIITLLVAALTTISPQATTQWLIQISLLGLFFLTLSRQQIDQQQLTNWFLLSLIPHALLAIQQTWSQYVFGSKWLGIAEQDPITRGVSVIETMSGRFLRAYGGFPHPNILGGWMSLGVLLSLRKKANISLILCTIALLLSFSRSAWLACFLGSTVLLWTQREHLKQTWQTIAILPVIVLAILIPTRHLWLTRALPSSRLEQKSLDERTSSLRQSVELIRQHPLLGTGPATTLLAISRTQPEQIPVPPHNVFVMMLVELGILGVVALILLLRPWVWPWKNHLLLATWMLPILLFDHYPWSLWSGQALLLLAIFLLLDSPVNTRQSVHT